MRELIVELKKLSQTALVLHLIGLLKMFANSSYLEQPLRAGAKMYTDKYSGKKRQQRQFIYTKSGRYNRIS